ncbi:hypothetical protein Tco_0724079, partial [Tanacetum coccineum]
MKNVPYASAVRSIMYAVRCTRPDVAFAQNITSRFQQNPGELHWTTVKNILKYLRNTKDMFLVYGGDMKLELRVSCYTDAVYLTDVDDLKSQTGYVFVLNREAEYIAAYDASKEAVWIQKFISRLGIVPIIEEPIKMYCDNTRAIAIAKESRITKGARHYRAKVHYLREVLGYGDVKIEKVHTDDNLADPFTKALPYPKHSELTKNIGMIPANTWCLFFIHIMTAACILNMVPAKKVEKTPYEVWHGQASKLSYLKVCGCEALVKRDTLTKPDKLEPISIKCIFVGYPKETMGYSFYYPPKNKVFVARNAEFFENSFITQEVSGSLEDLEIIQEEDTNPSLDTSLNHEEDDQEIDEPQSDINPIRRSTRTRRPTDRLCLYIDTEEHELGDLGEPANY